MPFDPAHYLCHVEALDMSYERKIEMIRVVAAIMESFVDRAFGTAPEQILLGTSFAFSTLPRPNALDSTDHLLTTFADAAHGDAARKSPP